MGTCADFYVGRGKEADWIGSIALDGYPDGDPELIIRCTQERAYRDAVAAMLDADRSGTKPEQGWPWPWGDSQTTDYAYAFEDGKVWASFFGHAWFDPLLPEPDTDDNKPTEFPDMTSRKNVTFGPRSGLIYVGPAGIMNLP